MQVRTPEVETGKWKETHETAKRAALPPGFITGPLQFYFWGNPRRFPGGAVREMRGGSR